jgi:hypothetical protein
LLEADLSFSPAVLPYPGSAMGTQRRRGQCRRAQRPASAIFALSIYQCGLQVQVCVDCVAGQAYSPPTNSTTHEATGEPLLSTPTLTANDGYPCAKLVVPSSGSTHHRYSELVSPYTPPSSPSMACSGHAEHRMSKHAFSDALSVSVTRSSEPFNWMLRGSSTASNTTCK